jgi:hypothetical protein
MHMSASISPSQNAVLPDGKPWNPQILLAITFFLYSIVAGLAFAFNWRKFGKPQWTIPTAALAIAIPVIGFGVAAGVIFVNLEDNSDQVWPMIPLFFAAGINFGYIFALWYLQNAPYQNFQKTGDVAALLNHQYNFRIAWIIVVVAGIGMAIFGSVLLASGM